MVSTYYGLICRWFQRLVEGDVMKYSGTRLMPAARFPSLYKVLALTLLVAVVSGCTQHVPGYTSPPPGGEVPVDWRPLTESVKTFFVVGPQYRDNIADAPETIPSMGDLDRHRTAQLGILDEIQIGLRVDPNGDISGPGETEAKIELAYSPEDDQRFTEPDFHAWPEDTIWLPELEGDSVVRQTFFSPYPMLNGVEIRIATFGADFSPGEATIGPKGAEVRNLPIDGEVTGVLDPGQRVTVASAIEGWAAVQFGDGTTGYVPIESFSSLPEPYRQLRSPLNFSLSNADGATIRQVTIPAESLRDNSHLPVTFDPIPDSEGRSYSFTLSVDSQEDTAGITVRATTRNAYREGELIIDGVGTGQDLVFQPLYAELEPLIQVAVDELPREGEWIIINDPPAVDSGKVVSLRIIPGRGPEADLLRYGIAVDYLPTGGLATTTAGGEELRGSLLLRTYYVRDVASPMLGEIRHRIATTVRHDAPMVAMYLITLGVLVAAGLRLATLRFVKEE